MYFQKKVNLFFATVALLLLVGCSSGVPHSLAPRDLGPAYTPASTRAVTDRLQPPRQVAVLLPLTGKYAPSGEAVRRGFLAANSYLQSLKESVPIITFIDTNHGNIRELYAAALLQGADFVVGPILKAEVATLAGTSLPVPTLALNTLDNYAGPSLNRDPNLYQFGLAPSDEIVQIANEIQRAGHREVLAIVPDSAWSQTLLGVFEHELRAGNGTVTGILRYKGDTDFSKEIATLLKVDSAQELNHKKHPKTDVIDPLTFRRQDVSAILLIAAPQVARQIRPFLKFYYAGSIPIYATSMLYSQPFNPQLDTDLEGVMFLDLPWILRDFAAMPTYLQSLAQQFRAGPPSTSLTSSRLYALGVDAYNLMRFLVLPNQFPANGLFGASGNLFLDKYQHIYHQMDWGMFGADAVQPRK